MSTKDTKMPVLDFSQNNARPYGRKCTLFSELKQSTRPTVGSNVLVGEIQHWLVAAQRFIQGTEYTVQILGDHPDQGLSGLRSFRTLGEQY